MDGGYRRCSSERRYFPQVLCLSSSIVGQRAGANVAAANVRIRESSGFPVYATFTALKQVDATYAWHETMFMGTGKEDKSGSEVAVSQISEQVRMHQSKLVRASGNIGLTNKG